ncbi:CrcB protein [Kytococcus aerolatus]|uniref:Fluoride-specific ion channel n=1 Tax=Kytococcus aerolatus TaxID=592308 RepID=A0A212TD58_9MICO|nr:CrcB family protein [Kytococcus aerolatus]SNC63754.1 CrcB protein [Kytococcus aerolatus]
MLSGQVLLWVLLGGAVGAVLRWAADRAGARWSPRFPELGVLAANVVASFLLGWVLGGELLLSDRALAAGEGFAAPLRGGRHWLVGAGLAGALSTFSSAVVQIARRLLAGHRVVAGGLFLATWLLCAGAARVGAWVAVGGL